MVIKSYQGKIAEQVHKRQRAPRLPENLYRAVQRKLAMVDAATRLDDLKVPPGNSLEKLKDDRKGQHAIRINDQWRVCFNWKDGDAYNVEITDYH
jgi:proteic killer suppression protein